jgi:hypothetical protein
MRSASRRGGGGGRRRRRTKVAFDGIRGIRTYAFHVWGEGGEEGGGGGGAKLRWMESAEIVPMRSASVFCSHRCREALHSPP